MEAIGVPILQHDPEKLPDFSEKIMRENKDQRARDRFDPKHRALKRDSVTANAGNKKERVPEGPTLMIRSGHPTVMRSPYEHIQYNVKRLIRKARDGESLILQHCRFFGQDPATELRIETARPVQAQAIALYIPALLRVIRLWA